jgi:hypothetical protein
MMATVAAGRPVGLLATLHIKRAVDIFRCAAGGPQVDSHIACSSAVVVGIPLGIVVVCVNAGSGIGEGTLRAAAKM